MQAGARFSLGTALWGLTPAEGYGSPLQVDLDGWLLQLIEQCADALFWLCFLRACSGARDWVLTTAPRVQINFSGSVSASLQLSQLSAVRQRLVTRGAKPVRLRVTVAQGNLARLAALPCFLQGVSAGITELVLCCSDSTPELQAVASAFLLCAAPELAALTHLSIESSGQRPALPKPPLFPQLQHLSVDCFTTEETSRSLGRYVKQLVSLVYLQNGDLLHLYPIFENNTTHTLITLQNNAVLNDDTFALILDDAPALKELTIGVLSLESDQHRTRQWAVGTLCFNNPPMNEVTSETLVRLPKRQGGALTISGSGVFIRTYVLHAEGLNEQTCDCLPMWHFAGGVIVDVIAYPDLPATDHPIALRNVCLQLATLPQPEAPIRMSDWQWTPQLAQDLQPFLPPCIDLFNECLTDELLGAIVAMGPKVHVLVAMTVALQSDQYADAAWPWRCLRLFKLDVAQVVKLPRPLGSPHTRRVHVIDTLDITHNIWKVDMERLLQWVGGVVWSWRSEVTVCAQCPPAYPADQALTLLQAQLQVLHAIGPDMCPQKLAVLRLRDWPMTSAIMQALQGLPQWPCAVHISTSQWPLEPNEYRSLAQYIPTSYHTWRLMCSELPPAHMDQVVLGIKEHRESLGGAAAQPVNVCVSSTHTAGRLRALVGDSEHVSITVQT